MSADTTSRALRVWAWLRWPTIVSVAVLLAAVTWQQQLSFSASANETLGGLAGLGSTPHGMIGRALRGLGKLTFGGELGAFVIYAQLLLGAVLLLSVVAIGRLVGLGDKALLLPLLVVMLPTGREAVATVSIETLLSAVTIALCIGICGLERLPRLAAMVVGGSFFVITIAHPMGAAALPLLIVVAGLWPRPSGPRPATMTFAARSIWLPWLAAVALCGGLLLVTLPDERINAMWDACMQALRTTTAKPEAGGVGDWPLVGPILAIALSLPLPVLLLCAAGTVRALKDDCAAPIAVVAALLCSWLLTAAVVGRPTAGPFNVAVVIAPLAAILAGRELSLGVSRLWSLQRSGRIAAIAIIATAILATVAEDVANERDDSRNAVARIAGLITDHNADRPAHIDASDIALLSAHPETTAILPANRDGNPLARRLAKLGIIRADSTYVRPFAARLVLVHMPAHDPISHVWASLREPLDCDAGNHSCLYRIKAKSKKQP